MAQWKEIKSAFNLVSIQIVNNFENSDLNNTYG